MLQMECSPGVSNLAGAGCLNTGLRLSAQTVQARVAQSLSDQKPTPHMSSKPRLPPCADTLFRAHFKHQRGRSYVVLRENRLVMPSEVLNSPKEMRLSFACMTKSPARAPLKQHDKLTFPFGSSAHFLWIRSHRVGIAQSFRNP